MNGWINGRQINRHIQCCVDNTGGKLKRNRDRERDLSIHLSVHPSLYPYNCISYLTTTFEVSQIK